MDQTTFQGLLTLLGELTNKKLSPDVRKYWWTRYGDLPADVLRTAFQAALDSCEFFPSPAVFNDILRGISAQSGAVVDGTSAWEAMQRAIFGCWSEANDRITIRATGYPWPTDRCKAILRGDLNLTVRDVAEMHPAEYAKTRDRFIHLFDSSQSVDQASTHVAKLVDAPPLRVLQEGA